MKEEKDKLWEEEKSNHWTHLVGVVFALSCIWMVWPAAALGWQWTMGVLFYIVGMFLMFLASTLYHWVPQGRVKRALRKCDHISIYVMIACSYTPILIALVGGWLGWMMFGILWAVVIAGTVYKLIALGKYPRLSLALYLIMGWSVVFIAKPAFENMSALSILFIVLEGLLYTAGTYFYAKDEHRHYHAIWHIFVLLGAMAHFSAVLTMMLDATDI